jgi:hypothetical protein
MRKVFAIGVIAMLSGCETMNDHPSMMNNFIASGRCSDAEAYAYRNFREDYLDWMLGNVALHCRRDRQRAIEYYKAGARPNKQYSHLSVRSLIEMGEKPPEQTTRYIQTPSRQQTQQQQPQVIIQQPQPNPNACIQDGGGTFCPNYRKR